MARELNYNYHCIVKHLSGAIKGLKEAYSKIIRDIYPLKDNLTEEKALEVIRALDTLNKIIKGLIIINYRFVKYEGGEKPNIDILLQDVKLLSDYRVRVESILIRLINLYDELGIEESKKLALYNEFLEVIADIYKAEQDHFPEVDLIKNFNNQENKE